MDKLLKPKTLDLNVDDATATGQFQHWLSTCENFMYNLTLPVSYERRVTVDFTKEMAMDQYRRDVLNNLVSHDIWADIKDCITYEDAKQVLTSMFIKAPSEVFARYRLLSTKQGPDQSLESFRRTLEKFSRECNFTDVTATRYREDSMLNAFIAGISHHDIRKRLLEEKTLTFSDAYKLATTLHDGHREARLYEQSSNGISVGSLSLNATTQAHATDVETSSVSAAVFNRSNCAQCGKRNCRIPSTCPALRSKCYDCNEIGHWAPQCPRSRSRNNNGGFNQYSRRRGRGKANRARVLATADHTKNTWDDNTLQHVSSNTDNFPARKTISADRIPLFDEITCVITNTDVTKHKERGERACASTIKKTPSCLSYATIPAVINGKPYDALIDSGSSKSYLHLDVAKQLNLTVRPSHAVITLANINTHSELKGTCNVDITIKGQSYHNVELGIFSDLCTDLLLGGDFLKKHKQVTFQFDSKGHNLLIDKSNTTCTINQANVKCPSLFANLSPDCTPIATKSRRYNSQDMKFIESEVNKWLKDKVCRPSQSPWRAQTLVVKTIDENGITKRRLCIDYSQTINLFTMLDAYPIPRIDTMVNNLAKYNLYATFDLSSAYLQLPISEHDIPYTAFEAGGRLYEMTRIPFGVTNGGPVFQRKMDEMVEEDKLKDTFPYFDNITIGGYNQTHLDNNIKAFLAALKKRNIALNDNKTISR